MSYTIYFDAEFQTFRVPKGTPGFEGYAITPPFIYHAGDENISVYHFLLSVGMIVVDTTTSGFKFHLASFPSLFDKTSSQFGDAQLLESGYTTCAPEVASAIAAKISDSTIRTRHPIFPYYSSLNSADKVTFESVHEIYNTGLTEVDRVEAKNLLQLMVEGLIPLGTLIHKGSNDIYALHNTLRLYQFPQQQLRNLDIDMYGQIYKSIPGVINSKLTTIKSVLVQRAGLAAVETSMTEAIREFVIKKYGVAGADVAAHNPLIDSLYAMLVMLSLQTLGLIQ